MSTTFQGICKTHAEEDRKAGKLDIYVYVYTLLLDYASIVFESSKPDGGEQIWIMILTPLIWFVWLKMSDINYGQNVWNWSPGKKIPEEKLLFGHR